MHHAPPRTTCRFVELNSLEHDKGSDFFSTDRGLFLSFLLENLGPRLAAVFQGHIERLVGQGTSTSTVH